MKLFVWDLHGTLERGNEEAVIELSNMALERLGYKERFQSEDARNLYGLKWFEYFEWLLPNQPHEKHIALQVESFALSDNNIDLIARHMRPTEHAHEVLKAIKDSHHEQILISNTIPSTIPLFISTLGLEDYFNSDNAFSVNAHAKEALRRKEDALDSYLEHKQFEGIIIIGDSATDIRLAEYAKATSYLYAHPGYAFRTEGGDHRTTDLRDILREI